MLCSAAAMNVDREQHNWTRNVIYVPIIIIHHHVVAVDAIVVVEQKYITILYDDDNNNKTNVRNGRHRSGRTNKVVLLPRRASSCLMA